MGWLRNPFRRPSPAPHPGDWPSSDSADDWQPGDLAECLHEGPWYLGGWVSVDRNHPSKGEIRMVKEVRIGLPGPSWLVFARNAPMGYEASGFRKVRLDPDRQFRREAEFVPVELIAPKRETQDA